MAIKKAASTKKATVKKPAAAKTTVRTVTKPAAKPATAISSSSPARTRTKVVLPNNIVNIVFAELVGTFILTLVALLPFSPNFQGVGVGISALVVSLTLVTLVIAIGAVSGAHVNPAVTFGLWAMRRLKAVLVPFYWGAQLLGAMLAVIVINALTGDWLKGGAYNLNFDHIWSLDWSIFGAELIAAAVFLFGIAAATSRRELSAGSRAFGVGLSLMVALLVGNSLLNFVWNSYDQTKWTSVTDVQHGYRVGSVTVNPAIALAAVERTDSDLMGQRNTETDTQFSRFTAEVVLGTLIGAAIGGNLYLLIAGNRRND
ncbi:hypothetical protein EOL96_03275 [Candidatus Saccharibacteria bacterium]|nr:hypothetical protein [Candidatus Saccharibacteria bacterium]